MLRKILLSLGLGAVVLTATACNTVQGVGRDIESVGKTGAEVIN